MGPSFERISVHSIVILLILVNWSGAYKVLIPADPENLGRCQFRADVLASGTTARRAPCQQLTCNQDGSVLVEGCGKIFIPACNRGERMHMNKPYPECCKVKYKCKNNDGSSYYIERDFYAESLQNQT